MNRYLRTALAIMATFFAIAVCALAYRYYGVLGGAVVTVPVVVGTSWPTWRARRRHQAT